MFTNSEINRDNFTALRQLRQRRARPVERCDLCGCELPQEHDHLIEPKARQLHCACRACAMLFSGEHDGRFRLVPRHVERLEDFCPSDDQWEKLLIPINLAFFFHSSVTNRMMAVYPSPAGATQSHLELDDWQDFAASCPRLADLGADVEALLVNRGPKANQYHLVSIDRCYELVGIIRLHWRGLSGGAEVWKHVKGFFEGLERQSMKESHHA